MMFAFVHFSVGAAVGGLVSAWPAAALAGLVSHFALDALPHLDPGTFKEPQQRGSLTLTDLLAAFVDVVVALGILWLLAKGANFTVATLAGALGGIAPDFAHPVFVVFPQLKSSPLTGWYYRLHRRIQRTVGRHNWQAGALVELAVLCIALLLLF